MSWTRQDSVIIVLHLEATTKLSVVSKKFLSMQTIQASTSQGSSLFNNKNLVNKFFLVKNFLASWTTKKKCMDHMTLLRL
jgi:hypothetical protein